MAVDFDWDIASVMFLCGLFLMVLTVRITLCSTALDLRFICYITFTTWRCRHSKNMSKSRFYDPAIQCYWAQEDSVTDVIARLPIPFFFKKKIQSNLVRKIAKVTPPKNHPARHQGLCCTLS